MTSLTVPASIRGGAFPGPDALIPLRSSAEQTEAVLFKDFPNFIA